MFVLVKIFMHFQLTSYDIIWVVILRVQMPHLAEKVWINIKLLICFVWYTVRLPSNYTQMVVTGLAIVMTHKIGLSLVLSATKPLVPSASKPLPDPVTKWSIVSYIWNNRKYVNVKRIILVTCGNHSCWFDINFEVATCIIHPLILKETVMWQSQRNIEQII